ncbi:hypothetical protein BECAL_03436 [Bellilinea caldifistulae]|jgi:hypothetical protein|uniref:Uncharacterized protein n=1 Tax=Bellilinea caldifistulae TaxID=360411 RepID=A0A0P6XTS6_9CHLR|nr:hypothetical protein [Bellilinea caldifistulae]KPL76655.1 hypothetical protein AC812_04865 [Bellilinea caldifistulae]GAP12232.1 hypothetical protein BECAL_03436 [Bellilinea caldifistulae]
MKRYNQVILDGQMSLRRVYAIRGVLAVEAVLTTDLSVLGGSHRVVCENDLALETLGFVLTGRAHREALHATVHGWLWSADERAHVVAREVVFHVPPLLREQAVNVIKQLRKAEGVLPERVAVNGWQVSLREMLADVVVDGGLV